VDKAASILIIDDEPQIRVAVRDALREVADRIGEAATGAEGLDAATSERPELVILDLGLPDTAGVDVCRELRRLLASPIIVLSARHSEDEKVLLLNAGADDYVTKPFSLRELVARIRAVSRRAGDGQPGSVDRDQSGPQTIGALELDRRTRRVRISGDEIALTAKEFDLLAFLANDVGAVHTRTEILESVWDAHWYGPTKTVDAHVASLRKKLGDHTWIESVRGVGFRLEPPA